MKTFENLQLEEEFSDRFVFLEKLKVVIRTILKKLHKEKMLILTIFFSHE